MAERKSSHWQSSVPELASRAMGFMCWTIPAQIKKWLRSEDVKTRNLIAECAGRRTVPLGPHGPGGKESTSPRDYRELEPGKKIVFTPGRWKERDGKPQPTKSYGGILRCAGWYGAPSTHEKKEIPNEGRRGRYTQGWNSVLDKLEKFLRRYNRGNKSGKRGKLNTEEEVAKEGSGVGSQASLVRKRSTAFGRRHRERRKRVQQERRSPESGGRNPCAVNRLGGWAQRSGKLHRQRPFVGQRSLRRVQYDGGPYRHEFESSGEKLSEVGVTQ